MIYFIKNIKMLNKQLRSLEIFLLDYVIHFNNLFLKVIFQRLTY